MITLDFLTAATIALGLPLSLMAAFWLFRTGGGARKHRPLDPRFVWICSICTYNYVNTLEETISVCPRCGNFNKR
jgi:hypothetical protein